MMTTRAIDDARIGPRRSDTRPPHGANRMTGTAYRLRLIPMNAVDAAFRAWTAQEGDTYADIASRMLADGCEP